MINNRVKISTVVESQLPSFIGNDFPLAGEFLKSYYRSQDSQSLPSDILSNIDQYVKLDNLTNLVLDTSLTSSVSANDTTIEVSSTEGFPDQYGIIQIDSEIITYTGITENTFTGCIRGFSGISSYRATNKPDQLVFSSTEAASHDSESTVKNLSVLFLQEFFKKVKKQIAPGFENRDLFSGLNENLFLKQTKDFYASKGADQSYEILFRALYGEDVELIRPGDYLFIPSDAGYRVTNDLVVEAISGDPELLLNKTLFQNKNQYSDAASGTITKVEKIFRGDKHYYVLSLDAEFKRDIDTVAGSIKGNFAINPKTRLLNNVAIGSTVLDVDSTVGFAATGEIVADLSNGTSVTLTYLSKSSNQFFDVSGASQLLPETQELRQNNVAYGFTSTTQENPVEVRIGAVLSDLVLPNENYLFEKNDKIEIQSPGKISDSLKTKNWFYNLKNTLDVKEITESFFGSNSYRIETYDENNIIVGDAVVLTDNTGSANTFMISQVVNKKAFIVSGINLPTNRTYKVQRQVLKGNSSKFSYISNYITNVQNTYLDNDDVYVTSNSIPSYPETSLNPEDFSVTFSGTFSGTDLNIGSHPFYTGDAVEYVGTGLNISNGTYFVKVVNSTTIRLAASKPNISNNNFFVISGTVSNAQLVKFGYRGQTLGLQKLIRLVRNSVDTKNKVSTEPGAIGLFVNGVEAFNYKSQDSVHFGEIENLIITAKGDNYDIINPPVLNISDISGSSAEGKVSVDGGLERIEIIDPGIDYLETPTISIRGGNGLGAIAEASLMKFIYTVQFNSVTSANQVDLTNDTVAFNQIHKLRNGERIYYETNGGTEVGGLVDKSEYYVGIVDAFRVKFYKTFDDAIAGKNIIDLSSYGDGTHQVSTSEPRKKISSIRVVESGSGYGNNYTQTSPVGINTASNIVRINNHGYSSGDIVTYNTTGTEVHGLSTALSYYVTKVDDNNFYLSNIGIGETLRDQFYLAKEYVNFESVGSGIHSFNYEPITVEVLGKIGLTTTTTTNSIIYEPEGIRSGVVTFTATNGQTDFNFNYEVSEPQLLDVFVNGVRLSSDDYNALNGTQIILDSPSAGGEVVEVVNYTTNSRLGLTKVSAGAGQTNYPFPYKPGLVDVYQNGIKLTNDDYESDTGSFIILNEAPAANDEIELISYHGVDKREVTYTAQEGQTRFIFDYQVEFGLLDVYVNGIRLPSSDYDATNPEFITLNEPVSSGDHVYLSYFYLTDLRNFGDFDAKIQPIFRGTVESVFLTKKGSGYGSSNILNYNRQPLITLNSGRDAELIPVINRTTGGIQDILINSGGSGYNSPPDLRIIGTGSRAVITPIVKNGAISEVVIVNPGVGYDPNNTDILVSAAGLGAKFEAQIKTWNVNLFEKLLQRGKISNDDSLLVKSLNNNLQYAHITAPRLLREQIQGTRIQDGKTIYRKDLVKDSSGKETSTNFHSPIIGWAYDGNPIYGPYGFERPDGGAVRRMVSSYKTSEKEGRPSLLNYPIGFFLEDWDYDASGDLDEHNGRFCVTPDYPDGVYAYFTTISNSVDSSGPFRDFIPPVFPYLIGPKFRSEPINFNFRNSSNQDSIDINETQWLRNTAPYNIVSNNSEYDYIFNPNDIKKQTSIVKYAQPGSIEGIDILSKGREYKVGDSFLFESDTGRGGRVKVSSVEGKKVSNIRVATTYIENVEFLPLGNDGTFLGIAQDPHLLNNLDIVSIAGLSTDRNDLKRDFQITVQDRQLTLVAPISSIADTGMVTHFSFSNIPSYPFILENDILELGDEQVKVLNIDRLKSEIRVLREQNSTVGTSHSVSEIVSQKSRRIRINTNYEISKAAEIDRQFYFDPSASVALGSTWGVGITSTLPSGEEIPTRTILLENHGLESGDKVLYNANTGTTITVRRNETTSQLTDNQELFIKRINNNLVSLAQTTSDLFIDDNLLQFVGLGAGVYHSLETVKNNTIVGQIERNKVTVSTASTHGLSLKDRVNVTVNVGITTTIKVVYNDYNRRLVINPRDFGSSDVNLKNDTIRINNHRFYTGQKVIFTSSSPTTQLTNDRIYYVVVFDSNKIRLSNTYFDSQLQLPVTRNFTSTFDGTISPINPQIEIYKDQSVKFDLSDSSLSYVVNGSTESAFDFSLYSDDNFDDEYITSGDLGEFNVVKTGVIGIDSDANLTYTLTSSSPQILYYALKPKTNVNDPIKNTIFVDNEKIKGSSSLITVHSAYSGNYSITSLGSTFFEYTLNSQPEKSEYDTLSNSITYNTSSTVAVGPISSIRISASGSGYFDTPRSQNAVSIAGTEAILNPTSTSIGKIKTVKIEDIGFDYPTDNTLRPSAKLSNIIKVQRFSSFESIGISSAGKGYTVPPKLIVQDSVTGDILDVELEYELGDTQVSIIRNTKDLYFVVPKIIPTRNSNGVGINTISYNASSGDVTVTLVGSFANVGQFPFAVGDKVFVESVATTSSARGYNSSAYKYSSFDVTEIDPKFGGFNATVTYNISSILNPGENPGSYDPINSAGRLIAEKNFPIFEINLKRNEFLLGEEVKSSSNATGIVDKWNEESDRLKLLSPFAQFKVGDEVEGQTSGTKAIITRVLNFESTYNISSTSRVEKGWKRETGFLNNTLQRIQDSDYYQYFSYSLKSQVSFDTWDEPVQSLNHTAGYKKFSDLIINTSSNIGITTVQDNGDFTAIVDVIGVVDTNCYFDWDLVDENFKYIVGEVASDEIIFNSRIIQNYFESVSNRVLPIDDFSNLFQSEAREGPFSTVDTFLLLHKFRKYITFVKDRRFTNERQLMLVSLLQDESRGYLNQYARVTSTSPNELGSFDFEIRDLQGNLDFFPIKSEINNYDISLASYDIIDVFAGVGSTSVGSVAQVYSSHEDIQVAAGYTATSFPVVSVAASHRAAKILVTVSAEGNKYQYDEITLLTDANRNVNIIEYGQLTNESVFSTSTAGFGTYDASVPRIVKQTVDPSDFITSSGISTRTSGSGVGPFGGFNVGDHTAFTGNGERQFTLHPIDSRRFDEIIVRAVVGTDSNGGEQPEVGESLRAEYSYDNGGTFHDFGEVVPYNGSGTIQDYTLALPVEAKTPNTTFRIRQNSNSGENAGSSFDGYGVKQVTFNTERTILDFYPNPTGFGATVNALTVGLGLTQSTGIGSLTFNTNTIETFYTDIASSSTPTENRIAGWTSNIFNGGYLIIGIEDATNDEYEVLEVVAAQDDVDQSITEFGNVQTSSGLGTVGIACTDTDLEILFTPIPNINAKVRVWQHSMRLLDTFNSDTGVNFINAELNSGNGIYRGTRSDIKRDFQLRSNSKDIFQSYFDPTTDPRAGVAVTTNIINLDTNTIRLGDNFFVNGEEVEYRYLDIPQFEPVGIATTTIAGISTDKLPSKVFIIKSDKFNVKVAASATDALSIPPVPFDITSPGIGVSHRFISKKQDQRVIVTIDDLIQSPIVSTSTTANTTVDISLFDDSVTFNESVKFRISDMFKIGDEICLIDSIDSSTNVLEVRRGWMGTEIGIHTAPSLVTKIEGNYSIIDSTINFSAAPFGPSPIGTVTNAPNDRDYAGITTSSSFSGRAFTKSSAKNAEVEPYQDNYIFTDISNSFNGIKTDFTLSGDGFSSPTEVTGIATDNAIILLNGLLQSPSRFGLNPIIENQYIAESAGVSTVYFNGAPVGGEIVSVGSTKGFGYQPLVSAGGTAIVSTSGTITAIAIGNSGSGYRSGIQTTVNVSVATSSLGEVNITKIGTASVLNGNVVGVSITNPGSGYTYPPRVIFDAPFSYEDLELQYTGGTSGLGTGARASIVVGQGSSVIGFELTEVGSAYELGDKLTVSIGGTTGIPTTSDFADNEFQLTVTDQYQEQFNGWNIGNLTIFDKVDNLFDGFKKIFPLKIDGVRQSIIAREGSEIDVAYVLLIFINGVLQEPKVAYEFNGGSRVKFTEAPRVGDKATILFYQGNKDVDVINKDILETVKVGDTLKIFPDEGDLRQDDRTVFSIDSIDIARTNTYSGVGILTTGALRPVIWCKQRSDAFVDGQSVPKNREEYESLIFPTTNIIKNVSSSDTVVFVENARTVFDPVRENPTPTSTRSSIQIIDQSEKVSAEATAVIIEQIGSVSSITLTNPGMGYTEAPAVFFETPDGFGTSSRAQATTTISDGKVTSITLTDLGSGYTQTPKVLIEPPPSNVETINDAFYTGDFGVITGIKTTSVGVASTGLVFDLYIPNNSFLKDESIVGTSVTVSGIQTGYYFVASNTNVGNGVTSLDSSGSVIMNGSDYLDNVYEAVAVSIAQTAVSGVGITDVIQVTVSLEDYNGLVGLGYSSIFGDYSWARIEITNRIDTKSFEIYNNGLSGIQTSPIVRRLNPLENFNYNQ